MTPKQLLITIFVGLNALMLHAQELPTHLSGTVDIDMSQNRIKASYKLTNIKVNSPKMSFLLNEDYDVDQIYLNGDPIASSKNGRNCKYCKVHTIWIDRPITPADIVTIDLTGNFDDSSKSEGISSEKGKIIKGRDFLTAEEASKWYPVIMDYDAKVAKHQQKQAYSYELKVTCKSCKEVAVGSGMPQKSGSIFKSDQASEDIALTAGNFEHAETQTHISHAAERQLASGSSKSN